MKQMTNEKYVKNAGCKCPYCKLDQLEGVGEFDVEGGIVIHEMLCMDCEKGRHDIYHLVGYMEY